MKLSALARMCKMKLMALGENGELHKLILKSAKFLPKLKKNLDPKSTFYSREHGLVKKPSLATAPLWAQFELKITLIF